MKKIFSFALALCFISLFSATAFAGDTTITPDSTNKDAQAEISATVSPTYTVTIPETVTLDETATISAENVLTEANKAVKVAIKSTDKADNAFAVSTGKASIAYTIKNGDSVMKIGDFLSFESDGSVVLSFDRIETNEVYVGDYKGTVTFTVSYEDIIK